MLLSRQVCRVIQDKGVEGEAGEEEMILSKTEE